MTSQVSQDPTFANLESLNQCPSQSEGSQPSQGLDGNNYVLEAPLSQDSLPLDLGRKEILDDDTPTLRQDSLIRSSNAIMGTGCSDAFLGKNHQCSKGDTPQDTHYISEDPTEYPGKSDLSLEYELDHRDDPKRFNRLKFYYSFHRFHSFGSP
jgi:hypothetical protein